MKLNFNNTSAPQILDVGVDSEDTTLVVQGSTASFPPVPFAMSIERGEMAEEAVLCVEILSSTEFSVVRGYDGTQAQAHSPGALIEHATIAQNYREAGIARVDETERDAFIENEIWEGRVIYNTDSRSLEILQDEPEDSLGDPVWSPLLPVGIVLEYVGVDLPTGWLWARGESVLKADWPALDAVLSAASYPFGSTETHMTLPDRRERAGIGVKDDSVLAEVQTIGGTGGTINHTHTGPSHTHTGPSHVHSGPSHVHTTPSTNSAGSHIHSQGNTGSNGGHSHTTPNTGSASVGSAHASTGASGLVSQSDIAHSHSQGSTGSDSHSHGSHSHSFQDTVSTTSGHSHQASGTTGSSSVSSDSHSHTNPGTSTYSPNNAHDHIHGMGNTGSVGDHTHTTPNTNSNGDHTHTMGNTGSSGTGDTDPAGTGATGSAGTGATGPANFPFIAMNYIIKAA